MPLLSAAALLLAALAAAAPAETFEDGLAAFRRAAEARARQGEGSPEAREGFRRAAEIWEELAGKGTVSTRLYTNIGNARAFAGDTGEAVLAYRRALVVDPENERARDALDAIRLDLGVFDRAAEPRTDLLRTLFFWHEALSFGARRALFGVLWIAGLAGLVLARRRRRLRFVSVLAVLAALALLASLLVSDRTSAREADAVLLVRSEGRTGDGAIYSASHSAPLPAGVELRILERRGGERGWVRGRLRDGSETWVRASAVAEVVPRGGRDA